MESAARTGLESVLTVCPYCSCGCGLYLQGTTQGVTGVSPSMGHPVGQGRLCARGWAAHEVSVWGPRLRGPLVRRDGGLRPASWPEALGAAANSLRLLRERGRAVGVLGSGRATNEENFLVAALARSVLGTPHVDAGLGGVWDALLDALGERHVPLDLTRALAHLERSELILAVEGDLAVTHPRVALSIIRALRRGGRLVTLGWGRTRLSALASLHLPLRTDAPLSGLSQLRIPLAERTDPTRVRHDVPDTAADAPEVRLACWLAQSHRTTFLLAPFDADPARLRPTAAGFRELAHSLAQAGRPEPLILPLPVRANTRGAHAHGAVPDLLPGQRPLNDEAARQRLRRVWGNDVSFDAGEPFERVLPRLAGLVVVADDVPAFHPRPAEARAALAHLSSLIVIDSVLTETARHAHVVLPMAAFGEAEGTFTNLEGRVQALRPIVAPPAGSLPGWQVLRDLAAALDGYAPASLEEVRQDIARAITVSAAAPAAASSAESASLHGHGAEEPASAAPIGSAADERVRRSRGRKLLWRDGVFDWSQDPLVAFSPTLRRDGASRARLHPEGVIAMSPDAAAELGVREGWKVRLRSSEGEAVVGVTLRPGLDPDLLLVPFTFRDACAAVLGGAGAAEVEVTPT